LKSFERLESAIGQGISKGVLEGTLQVEHIGQNFTISLPPAWPKKNFQLACACLRLPTVAFEVGMRKKLYREMALDGVRLETKSGKNMEIKNVPFHIWQRGE